MPTEGLPLHSEDPRIDHSWPCADAHSFCGILVQNNSWQIFGSSQDKDSPLLSGFCNRSLNTVSHFSNGVSYLSFLLLVDLKKYVRIYIYIYIYISQINLTIDTCSSRCYTTDIKTFIYAHNKGINYFSSLLLPGNSLTNLRSSKLLFLYHLLTLTILLTEWA